MSTSFLSPLSLSLYIYIPSLPFSYPPLAFSLLNLTPTPSLSLIIYTSKKAAIANLQALIKQSMKQLIRRLSRVADSSQYSLLRSDSQTRRCSASRSARRAESFRCLVKTARRAGGGKPVPEGHVPVYVGDEMERFVVSAELLNHPIFIGLLNKSAQEYGYDQKGVLRIPCHVLVFERVMEAIRLGLESRDLDDLLDSVFTDEYFLS